MATRGKIAIDSGPDDWQPSGADDWQAKPGNASDARAAGNMDLLKKFKEVGYKTMLPEPVNDALNGGLGSVDELTLHNLQYSPKWKNAIDAAEKDSPTMMGIGRGTGLLGLAGASFLLPGGPIIQSGIQGALTKPADDLSGAQDLKQRGIDAAAGSAMGGAMQLGGNALKRAGDWGMKRATGIRKAAEGMGNRIADEGIWGTKSMMRNQAQRKIDISEQALNDAINQMTGTISPNAPARAIRNNTLPYIPQIGGSGPLPLPSENIPFVQNGMNREAEALARGAMTPQEALSMSRAIAKPAYNKTGAPLDAHKWRLGQVEAAALKDSIKNKALSQGLPEVADSLSSEQALINARNGLDREQTLEQSLISHGKRGLVGGTVGYAIGHGLPGILAGSATATAAGSPLALSTLGQVGTQGAKAFKPLTPAAVDALIRQAMGNDVNDWESKK